MRGGGWEAWRIDRLYEVSTSPSPYPSFDSPEAITFLFSALHASNISGDWLTLNVLSYSLAQNGLLLLLLVSKAVAGLDDVVE